MFDNLENKYSGVFMSCKPCKALKYVLNDNKEIDFSQLTYMRSHHGKGIRIKNQDKIIDLPIASYIRDGKRVMAPEKDIVLGDIVVLKAEMGLPCPADVLLFEASEDFETETYLNVMDKPH